MKTIVSDNFYFTGKGFGEGTLRIDGEKIVSFESGIDGGFDLDYRGKYVYPGLIDPHSHIGVDEMEAGLDMGDTNEYGSPNSAHLRTIDAIFPRDPAFKDALSAGVTAVGVLPGSANPIGGFGVAIHTYGRTVDEMVIDEPIGMKMAFGENVRRVAKGGKGGPTTRMGNAAYIRKIFTDTLNYMEGEGKEKNLEKEAIALLLKRKIPARIHAHRDDDIMTAIRIAEEFKIKYVIEHASSSHYIMDLLAAKNATLVIGPTTSVRRKIETKDKGFMTAIEADKYGVLFSITCDHPVITIDMFPVMGSFLRKNGMNETAVMDVMTINGAKILGLENKIGSLEKGKYADFVVASAHPLDVAGGSVEEVYIKGKRVFENR